MIALALSIGIRRGELMGLGNIVSSQLGHANIATTGDIHVHALKSVDKEIAKNGSILYPE